MNEEQASELIEVLRGMRADIKERKTRMLTVELLKELREIIPDAPTRTKVMRAYEKVYR